MKGKKSHRGGNATHTLSSPILKRRKNRRPAAVALKHRFYRQVPSSSVDQEKAEGGSRGKQERTKSGKDKNHKTRVGRDPLFYNTLYHLRNNKRRISSGGLKKGDKNRMVA